MLRGRSGEVSPEDAVIELDAPAQLHEETDTQKEGPEPVGAITGMVSRTAMASSAGRRRATVVHGVTVLKGACRRWGSAEEPGAVPSRAGAMPYRAGTRLIRVEFVI